MPAEHPALSQDALCALVSELVAIPSFETEAAVQAVVACHLEDAGFDCRIQEIEPGRPNVLGVRGSGGPFLCSHADTQLPFAHPDPLRARISDGVLVGRGVLDAKGQIASLLCALRASPDAPAVVLITCDEEFGGRGSERAWLPEGLDRTQGGIVLEPTGFRVCASQAGNVEATITATGRPVHPAEPERGLNAIDVLQDALDALRGCSFLRDSHPLLPPPWRHVGTLRAGEHLWRVPGAARAEVSLAVLPGASANAAAGEVSSRLAAVAQRAAAAGGGLAWTMAEPNEPMEAPAGLPVVGRLLEAGEGGLRPGAMRSWTDAAHLLHLHAMPCVVFGAGELAPAHSDREWVRPEELVRLARVLSRLLESWPA